MVMTSYGRVTVTVVVDIGNGDNGSVDGGGNGGGEDNSDGGITEVMVMEG